MPANISRLPTAVDTPIVATLLPIVAVVLIVGFSYGNLSHAVNLGQSSGHASFRSRSRIHRCTTRTSAAVMGAFPKYVILI
jgi:hypothetical protein